LVVYVADNRSLRRRRVLFRPLHPPPRAHPPRAARFCSRRSLKPCNRAMFGNIRCMPARQ
jgi:hypothetical protein